LSNETPVPPTLFAEDSGIRPDLPGDELFAPAYSVAPLRPKFQNRTGRHILLLAITLVTTTVVGAFIHANFLSEFGRVDVALKWPLIWKGFWYSGTLLLILGAHEMGHYVFCRRYDVDATLPYFIPLFIPLPLPQTGTLGAVIRIREAFPNRKALFDIGVAGPVFGFVLLVPALFLGMSLSSVVAAPTEGAGFSLGEPLLFQWATHLVFGTVPDGFVINMHPMVFAAWFGMLATALNLLPFGQLDGGHLTYATLGRFSTPISVATVSIAIVMTVVTSSWLFMTLMMLVMLFFLGPRHPSVINEYEPLGRGRIVIALLALVMLIVCFTPVPIEAYDLIGNR
jgi:membrane-associated protease RseP (regulator of RpoE activity)